MSNLLSINSLNDSVVLTMPISMDASSSAYKIMSYFLFNVDLATRTNFIASSTEEPGKDQRLVQLTFR